MAQYRILLNGQPIAADDRATLRIGSQSSHRPPKLEPACTSA
jgi:hypothetical protein